MSRQPRRDDTAGRIYLDLRKVARNNHRPTDEIIRLYALECLVERITLSRHAEQLILKGGVLLAAFDVRRPTRDVDLAGQRMAGDVASVLAVIQEIASLSIDDGLTFEAKSATAEPIRDEDRYGGVRVALTGRLATARISINVDVNIGDPIAPIARSLPVPRLLGGSLVAWCYPLTMVLAEKLVTAMERGTLSTRWRDFVDIAAIASTQLVSSAELLESMRAVSEHRGVQLRPLAQLLRDYAAAAQPRWFAWRRKQLLEDRTPSEFRDLLADVITFVDPIIDREGPRKHWDPIARRWE